MQHYKTFFLVLLMSISLHCCKSSSKYSNAYAKIRTSTLTVNDPKKIVALNFSSRRYAPAAKKKTFKSIFDLSELAQYKLIAEYSSKDTTSTLLRSSIVEPLEKQESKVRKIVDNKYLSFPTRFTFFVEDKLNSTNPANRIASLRIVVNLESDGLQFEKFESFLTKYDYYDIASIENTSTRNFSLGATVGTGSSTLLNEYDDNGNLIGTNSTNFGPNLSANATTGNSITETTQLRKRVISQSGTLSSNQMMIYLEGNPQKNLNGPLTVEFSFVSNPFSDFTEEIEFIEFTTKPKVNITPRYVIKADDDQEVKADIFMEWTYRRVVRKGNTPYEGDDKIELITQESYQYFSDQKLLEDSDLQVETFAIQRADGSSLYVQKNMGKKHELRFLSQDQSIAFMDYLYANNVSIISGFKVVDSSGSQLRSNEISTIQIVREVF